MKIKIYQNDRETYFWTVDEVNQIIKSCPNFNYDIVNELKKFEYDFTINGIDITVVRKFNDYTNLEDYNFIKGINIFVFSDDILSMVTKKFIQQLIDLGSEYQFIIVNKNVEDYWIHMESIYDDSFIRHISNAGNIKVIWDAGLGNYKNFFFEPKVHIQNYYNNGHFSSTVFLNGNDAFLQSKKDKRIGIHFNKLQDRVRVFISEKLKDYPHDKLFLTINKYCEFNEKHLNLRIGNYESDMFNPKIMGHPLGPNFYVEQFLTMTIKSEMEVVYETFTTSSELHSCVKWNEKTIKHLFLGKPFIHMDPVAHKLMDINGFLPYRSLYSDELWETYENTDVNVLLKKNSLLSSPSYWYEKLLNNIHWLLDMDETKWRERINEANRIGEINRKKSHDLIFNTSLLKYVDYTI